MPTPIQQIRDFKNMSHEQRINSYDWAKKSALQILKSIGIIILFIAITFILGNIILYFIMRN